ncbi:MAG TPA: paraquat-inducible protein A [Desulfuromonadales bacterium]|nr:paraquat-inducible protein A [Desulfuromonadales bacterium]
MKNASATARELGLVSCEDCHQLSRLPELPPRRSLACPRCSAPLHLRKPNSLSRTWALIIASAIFYIPANVLPMTVTTHLGSQQTDTIISGVIHFMETGSFGIALIIFIASIMVPLMKLLILAGLLLSVHCRAHWRPKDRTRLYRLTESIGRWSMVDIYVITIMVALVKMGALADVDAGPAAFYFAAVVVMTMFAVQSFDPRLIWDGLEEQHE